MSIKLKTSAINFMKDGSKKGVADLLKMTEVHSGADWNASEGENGYVANRTHYDEEIVIADSRNTYGELIGGQFRKCSEKTYTKDELIGSELYIKGDGFQGGQTINEQFFIDVGTNDVLCIAGYVFCVYNAPATTEAFGASVTFNSTGTYCASVEGNEYYITLTKRTIKTLDPKFLPEGVPYVEKEIIADSRKPIGSIGDNDFFKVSEKSITKDDVIGCIYEAYLGDFFDEIINEEHIRLEDNGNFIIGDGVINVENPPFNVLGQTVEEKGIFIPSFIQSQEGWYMKIYKDTISKLDERCLPSEAIESIVDAKLNALTNVSEEGQ